MDFYVTLFPFLELVKFLALREIKKYLYKSCENSFGFCELCFKRRDGLDISQGVDFNFNWMKLEFRFRFIIDVRKLLDRF